MFAVWSNGAELELTQPMMLGHNTLVVNSDRTSELNKNSPTSEPAAVVEIRAFSQSTSHANIYLGADAISRVLHDLKLGSKKILFQKNICVNRLEDLLSQQA